MLASAGADACQRGGCRSSTPTKDNSMAYPKVRFNTTHYLKDLRALRNNLRNTRKYGANVRGPALFLKIDVFDSSEQSQIQVTMRRSSLYLHAFKNAQTTIYFKDTE